MSAQDDSLWGTTDAWGKTELAIGALSVAGLGLLFGSVWASRGNHLFGFDGFSSLARIVALVIFCIIAVASGSEKLAFPEEKLSDHTTSPSSPTSSRNSSVSDFHSLPSHRMLYLAAVSTAVYVFCIPLSLFLTNEATLFALGLVATLFEGISLALVEYFYLWGLACITPRKGAVSISAALLAASVYDAVCSSTPLIASLQAAIAPVASLLLALVLVRRVSLFKHSNSVSSMSPESPNASTLQQAENSRLLLRRFLLASSLIACLMLAQGLASQVSGMGAIGETNVYDSTTYIVVIGIVRAFMLLGCLLISHEFQQGTVALVSAAAMLTALLVTMAFWDVGGRELGMLMVEAVYSLIQGFVLIMGVLGAHRDTTRKKTYLCISAMTVFANQLTRFPMFVAGVQNSASVSFVLFSACEISVIALVVTAAVEGAWKERGEFSDAYVGMGEAPRVSGKHILHGAPSEPAVENDPFLEQELAFTKSLRELCEQFGLTERERDVIFQAMHGYTIDATAEILGLSRETVKTHLSSAYHRCGVTGKQDFLRLMGKVTREPSVARDALE